jgi:hypothetical protein
MVNDFCSNVPGIGPSRDGGRESGRVSLVVECDLTLKNDPKTTNLVRR